LLGLWWLLFLLSNWASSAALRLSFSGETPEELRASSTVYLAADSLDLIGAFLAIWVIRAITRRQIDHAEGASEDVEFAGALP